MGLARVLCFALLFLIVYVTSFTANLLHSIASHATVYSYTIDWVLLNPQIAIQIVSLELTRGPLPIPGVILSAMILGFVIDWILRILGRKR